MSALAANSFKSTLSSTVDVKSPYTNDVKGFNVLTPPSSAGSEGDVSELKELLKKTAVHEVREDYNVSFSRYPLPKQNSRRDS